MELNQFSTVDIVLDKANDNFIQKQIISVGDRDGRALSVQITDAGIVGEVPGLTLNLLWKNESSGVVDLTPFKVVNRATSVFRVDYPENMLTAGKVTAQIQLLHNGKATHSKKFEIIVLDVAGSLKGVLQTAEYTALVEALAEANKYKSEIDAVKIELDKKSKQSNIKVDLINDKNATSGTTNVANFAGQELGKDAPIGQIIHHYTDGTLYQVDNVGEGVFYIFRQANNPSRRPDKPANYVGTGAFFQFQHAKDDGTGAMKSTEYLLDLTNDADFLWRKQRPIIFTSTKTDDNTPAFMFQPQFEHKRVWQVNYKINTPLFEMQYNNNRAHIIVGNTVDGLNLQTIKGDIVLQPESKKVYVNGSIYGYEGGNYGRAMLAAYGAKSQRPTSDLYIGKFFFDTFLGKPVWYNGNFWVDAAGTVV